MEYKRVTDSMTVISSIMQPEHANIYGNVHGGEIMKLMDITAGVVARKHSRKPAVTAMVNELEFLLPSHIGDLINCYGQITYVGKKSMEVLIKVTFEDLSKDEGERLALKAYFTMVALDENDTPTEVPGLKVDSEQEKKLYAEGEKRYLRHKKEREQRKREAQDNE